VPRLRQVYLANRQRRLKVETAALRRLAQEILAGEGAPERTRIELVFLRDEPMARLNEQYRQRAGATDVLSFGYDEDALAAEEQAPSGSVVVSVDRALQQARERGHPVAQELARLVAHGVLHLLGYDDSEARARQRMRRREDLYLKTWTGGR
jgi:probable rRNA maturation factor